MDNLTTIFTTLISAVSGIVTVIISKGTNKKVSNLNAHILDSDKTYLIDFLSDIEHGITKSDIQIKRAYEIYERYTSNGGNSYVHDKWEDLKKRNLL